MYAIHVTYIPVHVHVRVQCTFTVLVHNMHVHIMYMYIVHENIHVQCILQRQGKACTLHMYNIPEPFHHVHVWPRQLWFSISSCTCTCTCVDKALTHHIVCAWCACIVSRPAGQRVQLSRGASTIDIHDAADQSDCCDCSDSSGWKRTTDRAAAGTCDTCDTSDTSDVVRGS